MRYLHLIIFCLLCNFSYSQTSMNGAYICNKIGLTIRNDTLFNLYHLYENDNTDTDYGDLPPEESYSCHNGRGSYGKDTLYCTDNYLVTENIRFAVG